MNGFKGGAVDRELVGGGSSPMCSPVDATEQMCSVASIGGVGSGGGVGNEGFPFDGAAERLVGGRGRGLPSVGVREAETKAVVMGRVRCWEVGVMDVDSGDGVMVRARWTSSCSRSPGKHGL